VALLRVARAFPLYSSSNGSVLVQSAYDGDVTLDAGSGKVAVRGLLSAESGVTTSSVTLNATTLNEVLLSSLAGLVQAQTTSLQQISAVFTAQTNVLTLQAMAANVTALQEHQKGLIESLSSLVNTTLSDAVAAVSAVIAANQNNVTATMAAQEASVTGSIASYYELVNSTQALQTQLLAPPTCAAPGGDKLQFSGTAWVCVWATGWSGPTCIVPPSPQPPSPPPVSPPPPLPPASSYSFQYATFTPGGSSGKAGPNLAQARSGITGVPAPSAWYTQLIMSTQGIMLWPVPTSGLYSITVAGATGGNAGSSAAGGGGRILSAQLQLTVNQYLQILVGQKGGTLTFTDYYGHLQHVGGGGGGTFVTDSYSNPLLIAGGGGGASAVVSYPNGNRVNGAFPGSDAPAASVTSGTTALVPPGDVCHCSAGISGSSGSGGRTANNGWGSGGGGFRGDGQTSCCAGSGGASFVNGGVGGSNGLNMDCGGGASGLQSDVPGGFGGGGGATGHCNFETDAGGGGGFSGGGASTCCQGAGGAGGNYVSLLDSALQDIGLNYAGDGWVNITFLHY